MTLSETCIRRPVLTTLVTASIIVLGIFAYRLLPVAALPAVDFPTITITGHCRAQAPRPWRLRWPAPIERQLSTIAGMTSLTSSSALGMTTITIQFDLNRNIDGAALDVQTALTVAARKLPVEMTTPPSFRKVNPGDFPVLYISLNFATLPLSAVNEYGEITLAQQISQLARRRAGAGLWRAEICRARAGGSGRGRRAQHFSRRYPQCRCQDQFQHARSERSTVQSRA